MAQRATVQQAVELLKIYQLRRENAAIHEQIKSLQDLVVDLKGKHHRSQERHEKNENKLRQVNTLVLANGKQMKVFASDIKTLSHQSEQFEECSSKRHSAEEQQWLDVSQRLLLSEQKCIGMERGIQEQERRMSKENEEFQSRLATIEERMAARSRHIRPTVLYNDDVLVEESMTPINQASLRSRIEDSFEEIPLLQTTQLDDENGEGQMSSCHGKIQMLLLQMHDSEAEPDTEATVQDTFMDSASTVPEDIDLDEGSGRVNETGNRCQLHSPQEPMTCMAEIRDETSSNALASGLVQNESEDAASYLRRGRAIMLSEPSTIEAVLLHQLVHGLRNANQRVLFEKWLDLSSWSWESLDKVAELVISVESEQSTSANENAVLENSDTRNCGKPRAKIETHDLCQMNGTNSDVQRDKASAGVRRSSRIAQLARQKSQAFQNIQSLDVSTEGHQAVHSASQNAVAGVDGKSDDNGSPQIVNEDEAVSHKSDTVRTELLSQNQSAAESCGKGARTSHTRLVVTDSSEKGVKSLVRGSAKINKNSKRGQQGRNASKKAQNPKTKSSLKDQQRHQPETESNPKHNLRKSRARPIRTSTHRNESQHVALPKNTNGNPDLPATASHQDLQPPTNEAVPNAPDPTKAETKRKRKPQKQTQGCKKRKYQP